MSTLAEVRLSCFPGKRLKGAGARPLAPWPIVHTLLHGVNQKQMMARHRANHVNIAYAPSAEIADQALATKAAMFWDLGIAVHLCGNALPD